MHEIQAQILKQLTLSDRSRYSAIKPPKIGGNNFSYHLKEVIKNGLVKKDGLFYKLTPKGEQLADTISLKTFTKRVQPKIVTMIHLKNEKGEIVFCRRDRQPFIGKEALPYGKVHLGERIEEAAKRESMEKIGLSTKNLKHAGDVYLVVYKENELVSHMLCHIFTDKITSKMLKDYCHFEKAAFLDTEKCVPGTAEILKLIEKNPKERFFREIFVED
jgi:8-oxo-dGTP pyrophosphatase MutT (NUDIX family)